MTDKHSIDMPDGHRIDVSTWPTDGGPIVQILHGLGEHAGRYTRVVERLNAAGYTVVAHDHRGHGAGADLRGHFGDSGGWQSVVDDAIQVLDDIRVRFPDRPIILLGHSMGSFIAQSVASARSQQLSALVLSGSTWPSRIALLPGLALATVVAALSGARQPSALLNSLGFSRLNKAFEPARTEYDWLSRDETEVDRYVEDPLCGGPFTAGLWRDFLGGMIRVGSDKLLFSIRSDLPILFIGGTHDPVGGDKGIGELMTHYAQTGHSRLKIHLYPGARHEMFNETNRDEVFADLEAFLDKLPRPAS